MTINLCAIVLVQYMASVIIPNMSSGHRSLLHFIYVPLSLTAYYKHSFLLINSSDPFKSWLSSIIKLLRPFYSVQGFFPSNFRWLFEAINILMFFFFYAHISRLSSWQSIRVRAYKIRDFTWNNFERCLWWYSYILNYLTLSNGL